MYKYRLRFPHCNAIIGGLKYAASHNGISFIDRITHGIFGGASVSLQQRLLDHMKSTEVSLCSGSSESRTARMWQDGVKPELGCWF